MLRMFLSILLVMQALVANAKAADTAAEEARGMVLKEELRGKRRLLRKLGHTDRDFSVLLPKGQASLLKRQNLRPSVVHQIARHSNLACLPQLHPLHLMVNAWMVDTFGSCEIWSPCTAALNVQSKLKACSQALNKPSMM